MSPHPVGCPHRTLRACWWWMACRLCPRPSRPSSRRSSPRRTPMCVFIVGGLSQIAGERGREGGSGMWPRREGGCEAPSAVRSVATRGSASAAGTCGPLVRARSACAHAARLLSSLHSLSAPPSRFAEVEPEARRARRVHAPKGRQVRVAGVSNVFNTYGQPAREDQHRQWCCAVAA
jgi:hypothetical protein